MKNIFLITFISIFTFQLSAQAEQDTTLIVNGVCGMCEKTIETAAKMEGVSLAEWESETLILSLKYDPTKVNLQSISDAIVKAGYDTELNASTDSAYFKLDPCCYYRDPNLKKH